MIGSIVWSIVSRTIWRTWARSQPLVTASIDSRTRAEAFLVGPEVEVDQLGDGGPGHQPSVDEPALQERSPERGDGGAVDDRLVEVEEGRLHICNGTADQGPSLSTRDN